MKLLASIINSFLYFYNFCLFFYLLSSFWYAFLTFLVNSKGDIFIISHIFPSAFAELQTDMSDLNNDIQATGVPTLDHRTFVMKVFFPGVTDNPVIEECKVNTLFYLKCFIYIFSIKF